MNNHPKINSERKRKINQTLRNDTYLNENNCFLMALNSMFDIFPSRKYAITFKYLDLETQLKRANVTLMKKKRR